MRNVLKRLKNNKIAFGTFVGSSVLLRNCRIGKHCYIAIQCIMNNTHIGIYTCIAPQVQSGGMQHSYWYPSISPILSKENLKNEVHIGNDVWIAAGAIIAHGITIGNGAVIGAYSFVNKDLPPYGHSSRYSSLNIVFLMRLLQSFKRQNLGIKNPIRHK